MKHGKAEMSRLEALAVGKACCARLNSYSRLKKEGTFDKPLAPTRGVVNLCIRSTPLRSLLSVDGRGASGSGGPFIVHELAGVSDWGIDPGTQ